VCANYDHDEETGEFTLAMPEDSKLISDYLSDSNYNCAYVGKWHLPTGKERPGFNGFVKRFGLHDIDHPDEDDGSNFAKAMGLDLPDYSSYAHFLNKEDPDHPTSGGATKLPLACHPTTVMCHEAEDYIRDMKDKDQPFFLTFSFIEPHPLGREYNISPCPYDRMYRPEDMHLPESRRQDNIVELMKGRNLPGLFPTDDLSDEDLQKMIAGYYGAVSYTDHLLGTLIQALVATDQFEDTLIIFTSDHGEMLGDHRMLKKGPVMFDEMIKVPLIIKPPASKDQNHISKEFVSGIDILPTILDYAGIEPDDSLPGMSLKKAAEGSKYTTRSGMAVEYHSSHIYTRMYPMRTWRTEEWKYTEAIGSDDELYDLKNDPNETNNLAGNPDFAEKESSLKAEFYEYLKTTSDPWPDIEMVEEKVDIGQGKWDKM
ncbi:MAG: sulfatase-like hydrolase/transferase, partial [Planctomycetota bacterium]